MPESVDPQDIVKKISDSAGTKIKVAITDLDGVLRGKYIHKDKFLSAVESGFGFCNVVFGWDCADICYDNATYTGWHSGYPDAQASIDLQTARHIPWDQGTPFFLADFGGAPVCPRSLLKKVIDQAAGAGFDSRFGLEFEWFNFRETPHSLHEKGFAGMPPLTPGIFGYSVLRAGENRDYFNSLIDQLEAFRVPLEGIHTETGPGVYEAAIANTSPLEAADRGVLFKSSTKEIAYGHGIVPTFMARWNQELPGCSGHIHQSLVHPDTGENLFYGDGEPDHMSPVFRSYLAGILQGLPEILPMLAPTVNSFKRLVEGFWAPTRANWGLDNRTVACRVISGGRKSTRLELRVGGSDLNPYLAIAASLACGLYGIRNQLSLEAPPITGNGYEDKASPALPGSLAEATRRMAESPIAREVFGEEFVDHFCRTRLWEWNQYQQAVTDWELKRYFEII